MNKVVGFQITAKDPDSLNAFYQKAFGWSASPGPHAGVTNHQTGNETLEGSIIDRGEHIPDYVSLFIETEQMENTLESIAEQGGSIIRPPFQLGNGDTLAIVSDPEGHVLTMIQRSLSV